MSRYPTLISYKVHAESFRVSVIHQTLTWTTGSSTCVHDHSCAHVYTQWLGTPTASQHNILDSEKLPNLSWAPDRIRTFVLWISSPTLYQFSHPLWHNLCGLYYCLCFSIQSWHHFIPLLLKDIGVFLWYEIHEGGFIDRIRNEMVQICLAHVKRKGESG